MTKRTFDIVFGIAMFLVTLPVILVALAAVWTEDRRNPLFIQWRYGKNKRIFEMYKIRTMKVHKGGNHKIADHREDKRVTRVGMVLRSIHFDELPQLWNIIKGDMSIVGPRPIPCIMKVDGLLNWEARNAIRPGITGMAQLYCTKYTSLVRKFHFDVLYIRKQSLWLDLKLIAATSQKLFPLAAFVLCTVAILVATQMPFVVEPSIGEVLGFDKLAHFGMFTMMGVASTWFGREFLGHTDKLLIFILIWGVLLGAGTEFGQSFQPMREMSFFDFVADMIGTVYIMALVLIGKEKKYAKG